MFACMISFITTTDSNIHAIGSLCTRALVANDITSSFTAKLLWAVMIGTVRW